MTVALDISLLGMGLYHNRSKTGISRVVETLLTGLHTEPDINLLLAASSNLSASMRYANRMFPEQTPPFINQNSQQTLSRFENTLLAPTSLTSWPSKAIRQVFYRGRVLAGTEQAELDISRLPARSIYHATFFALPDSVRKVSSLQKVVTIYDLIPLMHPEWFNDKDQVVRQTIASIPPDAHVVTISQATKDDFCTYTGFDPARVEPILLAASPDLFYPETNETRQQAVRQQFGIGDGPYLLSLATLEPRKNIDHLVRCFARLVESRDLPTTVNLVLVGAKGWLLDGLMAELARNQQLKSRLIITGFVPDQDLAALYSGALAFVYPSLYEGFGLPPLEAMQCGLPVITANVSSLPEVVGDAALLVDPTDADALCDAMLTMVNKSDVRADLSARSLTRSTHFSWDKFVRQHVDFYKRISAL